MSFEQSISYANRTDAPVRIFIEPWAERFIIRPGQKVDIVIRADAAGTLQMVQASLGLMIHAYENCIISIMSNGEELESDFD